MGKDGLVYSAGSLIEKFNKDDWDAINKQLGLNACEWLGVSPDRFYR